MGIRVLIADDHKMVRQGLRGLLENEKDVEVVAEAEDGSAVLDLIKESSPDLVIMDVSMPGLDGIEATRQITQEIPKIKVVALSMYSDVRFITRMIKSGASAYLLKDCAFEELVKSIRIVMKNQIYLNPVVADILAKEYILKMNQLESSRSMVLTKREEEVLRFIGEGKSTKEIAVMLGLSPKTIESHRYHIMNKLNINSLTELIKYALNEDSDS
jgi:DNA-binding NarL/FixJ family response regulator